MGQVARVPPEAPLSRTDDRRNLLIALGAAGVTLAVVLGVIGIPAVGACSDDPRGVVTCLRDMADRKFDLPGAIPGQSAERAPDAIVQHAEPTVVVDLPPPVSQESRAGEGEAAPASVPEPPMVVADVPEIAMAPAPAATPPVQTVPAERPAEPAPPAAIEVAATPRTPAVPPVAPAPAETALAWNTPPPEAPGPPPAVPVVPVPEPGAPVDAPADPLPAAPAPLPEPGPAAADIAPLDRPPLGTAPSAPSTQPAFDLAYAEPAEAQAPPAAVAAPLVLAPTIDAIELDGEASFVSGSGPAGALMRLFADGQLVGESPVEEGRWLVEGRNLLDGPRRELRVEAIEPATGRLLGVAAITVEIELPASAAPPDVRPEKPPEFGSGVAPADIADPVPEALAERSEPAAEPVAPAPEPPAPPVEPAVEAPIEPDPVAPPEPLPELAAVTPLRASDSVDILAPSELQPTVLPPIGAIDHEPATITLDPPGAPALVAEFRLPVPRPAGQPVTVLRLLPFGDPDSGRYNVGKAIIRHGDTLWSLARRYYGHGIHYRTIFHANRDLIRRPSRIFPGQVFELPLVTDD
jgi:nucleoid-associated protein YgaU